MEENENGNEKAVETKLQKRRREKIEKALDFYNNVPAEKQEEYVKELLEEKYRLLDSIRVQVIKNQRLRFTFNSNFIRGRNKYVSLKHADAIVAYLIVGDIAKAEAGRVNKGKSTYEYLYRTNARMLSKQFDVPYRKAGKLMNSMWDMGMWELKHVERDKLYVFYLGERKRYKFGYSDSWIFNLNKGQARVFYRTKKEMRPLILDQYEREKLERAFDRDEKKGTRAKAL